MSEQHFRVKVGKHYVSAKAAEVYEPATRIVLMLDTSGSMVRDGYGTAAIHNLADAVLRALPPQAAAGLVVFATTVEHRTAPLQDREALIAALQGLPADRKGRTALRDALMVAADDLQPRSYGATVMLITDGGDNASRTASKTVRNKLKSLGIRLLVLYTPDEIKSLFDWPPPAVLVSIPGLESYILTGNKCCRTAEESEGLRELTYVAGETGGMVLLVPTDAGKDVAARSIPIVARYAAALATRTYRLTIDSPADAGKNRQLRVEVLNDKGKRRTDLQVRVPKVVPACDGGEM